MEDLRALFEHELRDLYSVEKQLLRAFPELQRNTTEQELKSLFDAHLKETETHKDRLEEIGKELNMNPAGEECKAMKGLVEELHIFLRKDMTKDVKDAGLVAEAQRIEHYEIAGYGTAARYAKELGLEGIAKKLHETLKEERATDEKLTRLAEQRLNREAKS